jgi:DNA-binding transcriptional ArsR family regulator
VARLAAVVDVDAALRALADPNRRRILSQVRDQARPVGEIAGQVAMSQQAVSFHLRVLRGAGLVTERHERTRHLFGVRIDGLLAVRTFLDGFWPTHLAALKRAAEADAAEPALALTAAAPAEPAESVEVAEPELAQAEVAEADMTEAEVADARVAATSIAQIAEADAAYPARLSPQRQALRSGARLRQETTSRDHQAEGVLKPCHPNSS